MKRTRHALACLFLTLAFSPATLVAAADEHPIAPYTDPSQLDVPGPKHSYYKEPWRGFLETRSGSDFLNGIGVNFNAPPNPKLAARLLAETGFKAFRIEEGWGSVRWDETGFTNDKNFTAALRLCKQYGIRPTLLLNAHHGAPCPLKSFELKLTAEAAKGGRVIKVADASQIVPGRSGIAGPHNGIAAETIITAVDKTTGECQLSRPLAKDLPADKPVRATTLKFAPLYPVGTKEFDETADGWVRYALLVCRAGHDAGIDDFDVEIWNELSFGSSFTAINHYYDPPLLAKVPDFLNPGGSAWEMARRTVEAVKKDHPKARCIWGFSNTTFYHCPIEKLPPGTDGQSYHPYGTGTRKLPEEDAHKDHPEWNVEGFVPHAEFRTPEGWAHLFIKTEGLMRLLNPRDRASHPAGVERFRHYMTEHGVAPPETGVTDDAGAWRVKSACALRSFCLWLNKGVDVMHYFCAYDPKPAGMGLLPPNLKELPVDARFDDVATPPMKAIRNLTRAFRGAEPMKRTTPLEVEVTELGDARKVFDGDEKHPPLWQREAFAVLPWQLSKDRFVIAAYAMTYDVNKPWAEQTYRLRVKGLPGKPGGVTCYDPVTDKPVPITVRPDGEALVIELPAMDYPRLVAIGL